jgi:PadR family transcriptional regulator AphA
MSNAPLTPVSYLVLGLLSTYGSATPYDLKREVAKSVGYFWAFPHSQLYAEPRRLAELGLLEEENEESGRRRRRYSITDEGRKALEEWLRRPTSEPPQVRDIGLLKLFFADVVERGDVVALARAQEDSHRDRLAVYETLAAAMPEKGARGAFPEATLRMGLLFERAFVQFWSELAAAPPAASPPSRERAGRRGRVRDPAGHRD